MFPINKSAPLTPPKVLHPRAKKCVQSSSALKLPSVSSVSSCSAGRHRPFHFCSNSSLLTFLLDESYSKKDMTFQFSGFFLKKSLLHPVIFLFKHKYFMSVSHFNFTAIHVPFARLLHVLQIHKKLLQY